MRVDFDTEAGVVSAELDNGQRIELANKWTKLAVMIEPIISLAFRLWTYKRRNRV